MSNIAVDPADLRRQLNALFAHPDLLPDQLLAFLVDYLAVNQPQLPVSQVFGFGQFLARSASVITSEATSSSTYTDLATVGPQVTLVPDGNYVILYGARLNSGGAIDIARASVQINATVAVDDDSVFNAANTIMYGVKGLLKRLSNNGNNTVTMKYKADGGLAISFRDRWLLLFKYANL